MSDLNILTIRAIGEVQRINIETRAKSVRKEIGQCLSPTPIGTELGGGA